MFGATPAAVRGRASGILSATAMRHHESTHIHGTLQLSETHGLARTHKSTIHWLSLDSIEHRYLLASSADTSISLYDLESPKDPKHNTKALSQTSAHANTVSCIDWYAVDTGMFATSSYDGTVKVWDTNEMTVAAEFDLEARVMMHAMAPTGAHTLIAAATDSAYVRLCDLRSGAFAQTLLAQQGGCFSVAWSSTDPFVMATGGLDGSLKLWDIRRSDTHIGDLGHPRAHAAYVNSLLFTEDGSQIISFGHDAKVRVWSVMGLCDVATLDTPCPNSARQAVQMSRTSGLNDDADLLFVPCEDKMVQAVDLTTMGRVSELVGHFERATCTAWRTGHMEMYSGGGDSSILVWTPPARQHLSADQLAARQDAWSDDDANNTT